MPETRAQRYSWALLTGVLTACCYFTIAPMFLGHRDLGWHIVAGDWIRAHGNLPAHDPWSYTAGTQPWYNLSWLSDIAISLVYQHAQFAGLVVMTLVFGGVIAALLALTATKQGASPVSACLVTIVACYIYPACAPPDIFLAAAPQIVTLLFSVLTYMICLDGRRLWLLPLLMLVWANLHNGYVAGFAVMGVFALEALYLKHFDLFKRYLLVGALSIGACLLTPWGTQVLHGILLTLNHPASKGITEWQPFYTVVVFPASLPAILYILCFVCLDITAPKKAPFAMRLLAWAWLILGMKSVRFTALYFLFSAPVMALYVSARYEALRRFHLPALALIAFSAAGLSCMPMLYGADFPQGAQLPAIFFPKDEIAYLQRNLPHARVLNHWNYGGYIIFASQGSLPVFIDGRSSTAYPDGVINDFMAISHRTRWDEVLDAYHIDAVLWPRNYPQAREFFIGNPRWKLLYSGPIADIFVRNPTP